MITVYDFKILSYLTFILIIFLLPIWLFRKRWKEVGVVAGVIIYFFVLNRDLIWGELGTWHDTRGCEYFLIIFKQWLDAHVAIGWNPYMGAGEPLYLLSNFFLRAPWVFFCWANGFIDLNAHTLFNIYWVFLFVNFCIGGLLLFLLLYDDFRAALFSFIALILSGMFIVNLGQAAGLTIMYYFPYILFCIILSCKRKNIYGISLAVIFLGIALNHYVPLYIILTTGIFLFFFLVLNLKFLSSGWRSLLKSKYKIIFLVLVISLLAASPALFSYIEIQNYISPTRGGLLPAGAIELGQTGSQPNVNAPLWGYKVLLEKTTPYLGNIHHAFYFGIIPLLLIPVALLKWRNRYFWAILTSSIIILFLSTGNDFWGYRLLIKHVPGFNMVRHSFGLAHFVSFLLICLSGYGFKELLRRDFNKITKVRLTILIAASFIIMLLISQKSNVILFGSLNVLIILFLSNRNQLFSGKIKNSITKQFYMLIILLLLMDLTLFYVYYNKSDLISESPLALADIVYPYKRTFYTSKPSYPLPPDFSPLIFKEASLTYPDNNFMLFRNERLQDMFNNFILQKGCEGALGVNGPIIYFTNHAKILPEDISKEQVIKSVYEDALRHLDIKDRQVFLSENDTDSYYPNNDKAKNEKLIKYTKAPNKLEVLVRAPTSGFLVRLENFHRGWQAFIDGKKTRIHKANYAFHAIRIPEGEHKVSFIFSTIYPLLLYIHIFCVFLTWVGFNFYLFTVNKKNCLKTKP